MPHANSITDLQEAAIFLILATPVNEIPEQIEKLINGNLLLKDLMGSDIANKQARQLREHFEHCAFERFEALELKEAVFNNSSKVWEPQT